MVYWTIQHKKVIDILNGQGKYFPDFEMSPQTHRATYDKLLSVFNELNETAYKGLIFCIAKDGRTQGSLTFQDDGDFVEYMKARPGVLRTLNNGTYTLLDDEHLLCRVDTDKFDKLYLCLVDFWNFIMMMPDEDDISVGRDSYEMCRYMKPDLANVSYDDFIDLSWDMMRERKMVRPLMSSTILQAAIPYLKKDMLKGTYPVTGLADVAAT